MAMLRWTGFVMGEAAIRRQSRTQIASLREI
jgi:hypothetical protein